MERTGADRPESLVWSSHQETAAWQLQSLVASLQAHARGTCWQRQGGCTWSDVGRRCLLSKEVDAGAFGGQAATTGRKPAKMSRQ
jgi:hypothetical protein